MAGYQRRTNHCLHVKICRYFKPQGQLTSLCGPEKPANCFSFIMCGREPMFRSVLYSVVGARCTYDTTRKARGVDTMAWFQKRATKDMRAKRMREEEWNWQMSLSSIPQKWSGRIISYLNSDEITRTDMRLGGLTTWAVLAILTLEVKRRNTANLLLRKHQSP